jgi:hypothetical protein
MNDDFLQACMQEKQSAYSVGPKKTPVPDRPYFFCRPYYFFNAIDRVTLFSLGGCSDSMPKWRLLSH